MSMLKSSLKQDLYSWTHIMMFVFESIELQVMEVELCVCLWVSELFFSVCTCVFVATVSLLVLYCRGLASF